MIKTPPYLKKGATIGITCPAGYMALEKVQTCIATLQSWGYEVMLGKTIGSQSATYFSGTDDERRDELQAMMDDPSIDAIICGRGGYGLGRIIEQIDFKRFKRNPKWIVGFSDITILHSHLHTNCKIASLHAPMAAAFNDGGATDAYVLSLKSALSGKRGNYTSPPTLYNRAGKASGELVGGNLSLLVHCIGTTSDLNTKNKILFIEDIGEQLYSIDRMFFQLKRAGKLDKLAGLVLGGFTDLKDTERPFGQSVYEIVQHLITGYDYPVCFDFPVSHAKENVALKTGVKYALQVQKKGASLKEL